MSTRSIWHLCVGFVCFLPPEFATCGPTVSIMLVCKFVSSSIFNPLKITKRALEQSQAWDLGSKDCLTSSKFVVMFNVSAIYTKENKTKHNRSPLSISPNTFSWETLPTFPNWLWLLCWVVNACVTLCENHTSQKYKRKHSEEQNSQQVSWL